MFTKEIDFLMWMLDSIKKEILRWLQKKILFVQSLGSSKPLREQKVSQV